MQFTTQLEFRRSWFDAHEPALARQHDHRRIATVSREKGVVITRASSGIGRETGLAFSRADYAAVLVALLPRTFDRASAALIK